MNCCDLFQLWTVRLPVCLGLKSESCGNGPILAGLTGVAQPVGNVFDWGDVTGVAGYAVFRANKSGGPYVRITTDVLTSSDFIDTKAPAGSTRYYRIVAVDEDGEFGMPANLGVTRAPAES